MTEDDFRLRDEDLPTYPDYLGLLSEEDVGWIVKLLREGAIKSD